MLFIGFKWIVFTNELDGVDPVDNIESMGCQESKLVVFLEKMSDN